MFTNLANELGHHLAESPGAVSLLRPPGVLRLSLSAGRWSMRSLWIGARLFWAKALRKTSATNGDNIWVWINTYKNTILMGWTSIYQLFWGSLGTRVLTHPHMIMIWMIWECGSFNVVVQGQCCNVVLFFHDSWLRDNPLLWLQQWIDRWMDGWIDG